MTIARAGIIGAALLVAVSAAEAREPSTVTTAEPASDADSGRDTAAATADRPAEPGGDADSAAAADGDAAAQLPGPFPIPDNLPAEPRFVAVELHGEVNLGMAAFIERVTGNLEDGDILVLDINTFGGRVDAAVRIRDALLHAEDVGARTVAYVNPRAISAGALISFAADAIVVAPAATMGAATPVQAGQGGEMQPVEEKVVSYMRQEMRATAEARGRSGDIAEAMVDADNVVPGLSAEGKLLTLDGKRMLSWGVASFEARNLDGVIAGLGYEPASVTRQQVGWSWAEEIAGWLSSSLISGLLMTLGMLGIMIGLYTGGSPIPLSMGGTCLALFFFGHHVVSLAGIEDILLFLLGVGLIVVEFVIPGNVFAGVAGLICIVASLVLGLIDFDNVDFDVQWQAGYISRALATVFGSLIATGALAVAAFRFLPESRFGRHLVLAATVEGSAVDADAREQTSLIGQRGSAVTALRPAGKVTIGDRRYEAVSDRGFVEAGAEVRVIGRRGFSVVVVPAEETAS